MAQSNLNEQELNRLLNTASKKMNLPPEELKRRLQDGSIREQDPSGALARLLANPAQMKQMLETPKAQALLKKLMNGNGFHG